jgi:uncharacterized membrane protein YbhN (UPF0104 family)
MKRSVLFWSIIALFGLFIVTRLGDLTGLYSTLAGGQWQWVVAAVILQVCYFALVSLMYKEAMAVVGIRYRIREMAPADSRCSWTTHADGGTRPRAPRRAPSSASSATSWRCR